MEKRVELDECKSYSVNEQELLRAYTTLSLARFINGCSPDYDQLTALKRLKEDYRYYLNSVSSLRDEMPNDLRLYRILKHFEYLYNTLKRLLDKE